MPPGRYFVQALRVYHRGLSASAGAIGRVGTTATFYDPSHRADETVRG